MASRAFDAVPNVLHGQRIPNTLGGFGLPSHAPLLRVPLAALAATAAVIMVVLVVASGRAA
jgi:hypothetical protein